jgi:hypothetical protein
MKFVYNRQQFLSVFQQQTGINTLAAAYCGLVVAELALKDFFDYPGAGHDVPLLLQEIEKLNGPSSLVTTACIARRIALDCALKQIRCQSKVGACQTVPSHNYPFIRYLRYELDWPTSPIADKTQIAHLQQLEGEVIALIAFLISQGII